MGEKPVIVWEDPVVGHPAPNGTHIPSETTGGIRFGGAVIFTYKSGIFYSPLFDSEKTREKLEEIGLLGASIILEVVALAGIDQVQVKGNYQFYVYLAGVYKWNERRPHVVEAVRKACEDHGYILEKLSESWEPTAKHEIP